MSSWVTRLLVRKLPPCCFLGASAGPVSQILYEGRILRGITGSKGLLISLEQISQKKQYSKQTGSDTELETKESEQTAQVQIQALQFVSCDFEKVTQLSVPHLYIRNDGWSLRDSVTRTERVNIHKVL